MPRNKKTKWRTLSIPKSLQNSSNQRSHYTESHYCQKCGRNLNFYTYRTGQLCQICSRDERSCQSDIQIPGPGFLDFAHLQSRSGPVNDSLQGYNMLNSQQNNHIFPQEKYGAHSGGWQRRIYFSDANKRSHSFNNYEHSQVFYQQSPSQRTVSSRSPHDTQPSLSVYEATSNYELSSTPSTSFPSRRNGDYKRKREPDDAPSKRIRASPYETASQICQYDQLSINIMSYFRDNVQTDWVFDKKMELRFRLQQIILRKFSGCNVFVFGSSMTGFATKNSDADMSLIFSDAKIVQNRVVRILWELHSLFSRHQNFKKLQVIRAKVSILKFKDTLSGFEIDLNINNPTGIRNSQLLRSYARVDDRVRPLILAVKFWAREHDINDAKNGTLSSYCLGLMLIHYLQYGCNPPVLPSLQILQPDKYSPNSDVSLLELDEILPNFKSENTENLGQLFVGFLHYYSKSFNYKEKRISVRLGCLLPRVDKILTKEKNLRHWIDIEEPFEQVNTARAVNNSKKAAYIKSVFDYSYNAVVQKGDLGCL
ncbi:poly(A) RNA polymerase GLD2 [Parasteatoda tepidariorum]|uniref:poly(A) RNA polymerase GLD2 n=1 Tax=Parasteatoda tepidariorum TaxID=114398 RepID=UPI001C71DBEE|nr:poly(A) RNA polymerase GLD2 [Parasteatoda tepidariorum]XP_015912366.2 poly(A) RNA polymerase GLD2 [Parasteatoda tepidariorum]